MDKDVVTPKMVVIFHALLESLVDGLNKEVPEIDMAVVSELKAYSSRMTTYIDDAVTAINGDINSASLGVKNSTHWVERYMLACWLDDRLTGTKAFWRDIADCAVWMVSFRGKTILPVGNPQTKNKKPYVGKAVFCDSALEALRVQKKMRDDSNKSLVINNQPEE